ncbi:FecR domain-containing protein [Bradyrhizobium archetypum]|uniref:FecR domain-containing protein n=1 Tax=Bradyrhizobium archetypum TaxID=2721160 RepID=A0A7Y4H1V0_9BRAD|nr:FecR domain-containing protein [Bradyrhizobium archetypum]NOJ46085.1 FecR domain-containing protein [Bradyrhizobium archetypum]
MGALPHLSRTLAAMFFLATASVAYAADGGDWTVSKSSGEVWLTGNGVQQASLKQEDVLKPGDTVRTGRHGRVLLTRGEEVILVAPNSVVGLPVEKKEGLSTTIMQQAGSILLDVEKRNVKHFEVETPYLAAVVKGTQFRVTVNAGKTTVDVIRGQVEVADFKSGQIAQVMAGQHATAFANGKAGLSLGGAGVLAPIEPGKPRAPLIERVPVPRNGLSAPRHAANGLNKHASVHPAGHGVTRISSSIGEVRVNFHRVTNGLAHGSSASAGAARGASKSNTVWSSSTPGTDTAAANNGQGDNGDGAAASAAGRANGSAVAAVGGGNANSGNGNSGDGNSGNGNGNGGNGNSGSEIASNRGGNGANGSGRGNSGHGRGR